MDKERDVFKELADDFNIFTSEGKTNNLSEYWIKSQWIIDKVKEDTLKIIAKFDEWFK